MERKRAVDEIFYNFSCQSLVSYEKNVIRLTDNIVKTFGIKKMCNSCRLALFIAYSVELVELTVSRERQQFSCKHLMRFVYVLYISYPKIIALKSIFDSTDDETKSGKGEHVLAMFKSNN